MTTYRVDFGFCVVALIVHTGVSIGVTAGLLLSLFDVLTPYQIEGVLCGAAAFHIVLYWLQLIWAKRLKGKSTASLIQSTAYGSEIACIYCLAGYWFGQVLLQKEALLLVRNISIASAVLVILLFGLIGSILLVRDLRRFVKDM